MKYNVHVVAAREGRLPVELRPIAAGGHLEVEVFRDGRSRHAKDRLSIHVREFVIQVVFFT
jgi:hypothetical protein